MPFDDKNEKLLANLDLTPLKAKTTQFGTAAELKEEKILLGGAFFEHFGALNTTEAQQPNFKNVHKEALLPVIDQAYSQGLTGDPALKNGIARVYPFSVNPNDSAHQQLIAKFQGVQPYVLGSNGQPVTYNGRRVLNLSNSQVRQIVKDHFVGTNGVSSKFAGLFLAGFEDLEMASINGTNIVPSTLVNDARNFMKDLCVTMTGQGKTSVIGDMSAHDVAGTGTKTIRWAAQNNFAKNIAWRAGFNNADTNNPLDDYNLDTIRDIRNDAPDANILLTTWNMNAGTITTDNARKIQNKIAERINLNAGQGRTFVHMSEGYNLALKDVKTNADIALATRSGRIVMGEGGAIYKGTNTAETKENLFAFNLPASVNDAPRNAYVQPTSLSLINPFLLDYTTPTGQLFRNALSGHPDPIVRRAGIPPGSSDPIPYYVYKKDGKEYVMPNLSDANVRQRLKNVMDTYGYGVRLDSYGEYLAVLSPNNLPLEYKPVANQKTVITDNQLVTTTAQGSQGSITINTTTILDPKGSVPFDAAQAAASKTAAPVFVQEIANMVKANGQYFHMSDPTRALGTGAAAQAAVNTVKQNATHLNVVLPSSMNAAEMRQVLALYTGTSGAAVPLRVTMTGVSTLTPSIVTGLETKLGTALNGLPYGRVSVYYVEDGLNNPVTLDANRQLGQNYDNARKKATEESMPEVGNVPVQNVGKPNAVTPSKN